MPKKTSARKRTGMLMVWLRRLSQAFFLALFLSLFWAVRSVEEGAPNRLLLLFFDLDPLILAGTWLSTRAVPAAAFLALITVAATLVLGRVFCGWFCPLGAVHHFASWLGRVFRRGRAGAHPYSPWQRSKYYLLITLLVMALFGAHWIGVFDPISQLFRVTATVLYPATQYAVEEGATAVWQKDPGVGPVRLKAVTEPVYAFTRDRVFRADRQTFAASTLIAGLFLAALLLNLYKRRWWCRYACPAGALLGLLSKRSALRVKHDADACTQCGRCAMTCPAGAEPDKPGAWRPAECFMCWNCQTQCNLDAIHLGFASPLAKPTEAKVDLGKRATLAAGAGGVAALAVARLEPHAQAAVYRPALIRPPGAREEREFLKRCLQCGLCMKACPTNALHPAGLDAGLEGLWTPRLIPQVGYCEYNCVLCGQVCPTEAIEPLTLEEKHATKIGMATVDRSRCLPWAYDRECIICEEHCPVSPKAIFLREKTVTREDGSQVVLQLPHVDPDRCVGCGICEAKCVFKDRPAIRVTSANESRHPDNQPIMSGGDYFQTDSEYFQTPPDAAAHTPAEPYGADEEETAGPYGG